MACCFWHHCVALNVLPHRVATWSYTKALKHLKFVGMKVLDKNSGTPPPPQVEFLETPLQLHKISPHQTGVKQMF